MSRKWSESSYFQTDSISSNSVEDVRGSLPQQADGPDSATDQKDAMEAEHDFWSMSGNFIQNHEELVADRAYNSLSFYKMVQLPIPVPKNKTMTIPVAKVALDSEWRTFFKKPAWQESEVRNKKK